MRALFNMMQSNNTTRKYSLKTHHRIHTHAQRAKELKLVLANTEHYSFLGQLGTLHRTGCRLH